MYYSSNKWATGWWESTWLLVHSECTSYVTMHKQYLFSFISFIFDITPEELEVLSSKYQRCAGWWLLLCDWKIQAIWSTCLIILRLKKVDQSPQETWKSQRERKGNWPLLPCSHLQLDGYIGCIRILGLLASSLDLKPPKRSKDSFCFPFSWCLAHLT